MGGGGGGGVLGVGLGRVWGFQLAWGVKIWVLRFRVAGVRMRQAEHVGNIALSSEDPALNPPT